MTSVLFRDVTTSYPEQTTIQDRTNSGLDIPQGTSDRRRCYRAWATSSSSSRAVDSHQCHGVKRPHLTLEKAPRAGLGKIKRRELDCYSLACAVCKSADAQNYEEID